MTCYDDIINLDRPISKYPKMSLYNRAAQFAPFAALSGYSDRIKDTSRLTNSRIELTEDEKSIINNKLNIIKKYLTSNPKVKITYFIPDNKKNGGKYINKIGSIKKINSYRQEIIMLDNTIISINEIIYIKIEKLSI